MSTSWQGQQEPEPQWNQPPFAPGYSEPEPPGYATPQQPGYSTPRPYQATPPLPDVVTGSVLVPHAQIPPPGGLESVLRVLSGVLWPVVIAILIFGGGRWWFGIIFAIIASGILKQVTGELKRRRVLGARVVPPSPGQPDLR